MDKPMKIKEFLIEELTHADPGKLDEKTKIKLLSELKKADDNASLKELWHITPKMMTLLYSQGRQHYLRKDYSKASATFRFLHLLEPLNDLYVMGIGASEQMKKDYAEALYWYWVAEKLSVNSPLPNYYASDCYEKLNMPEYARYALTQAIEKCKGDHSYKDLQGKIELILEKEHSMGEKK